MIFGFLVKHSELLTMAYFLKLDAEMYKNFFDGRSFSCENRASLRKLIKKVHFPLLLSNPHRLQLSICLCRWLWLLYFLLFFFHKSNISFLLESMVIFSEKIWIYQCRLVNLHVLFFILFKRKKTVFYCIAEYFYVSPLWNIKILILLLTI